MSESVSWSDFVKQVLIGLESNLSPNRAAKQTSPRVCVYSAALLTSLNIVFFSAAQSKHLVKPVEIFLAKCQHKLCTFQKTANSQQVHRVHLHSWVLSNQHELHI